MVDRALLEQAKSLAVEDRWELVNELWESLENEDFPVAPGVDELLRQRRAEYEGLPLEGPTWPEIKAEWHRDRR